MSMVLFVLIMVVFLALMFTALFKPSLLIKLEKSNFVSRITICIALLITSVILLGMTPNPHVPENQINNNFVWTEKPYPEIGSIVGTVKNIANKEFKTVTVKFILVDDDGNKLDDANCVINNFKPGVIWTFSAPVYQTRAAGFKFMGIEAN